MDIVKSAKEIGSSVEEKIEHGLEVAKETFANVASHLPFANLAKKGSDTFRIEIDLPGVKKEDIELKVEENLLTVKAVRKMHKEIKREDLENLKELLNSLPKDQEDEYISQDQTEESLPAENSEEEFEDFSEFWF